MNLSPMEKAQRKTTLMMEVTGSSGVNHGFAANGGSNSAGHPFLFQSFNNESLDSLGKGAFAELV